MLDQYHWLMRSCFATQIGWLVLRVVYCVLYLHVLFRIFVKIGHCTGILNVTPPPPMKNFLGFLCATTAIVLVLNQYFTPGWMVSILINTRTDLVKILHTIGTTLCCHLYLYLVLSSFMTRSSLWCPQKQSSTYTSM